MAICSLRRIAQAAGLMAICLTVACESQPEQQADGVGIDTAVDGAPADVTLAGQSVESVEVGEITECVDGDIISLVGDGHRRLAPATEVDEIPPSECRQVPGDDDSCPVIRVDDFYRDVRQELEQADVSLVGVGLSPCQSIEGTNVTSVESAFILSDWRDVDPVIEVVARRMQRWDIDGDVGVAVQPESCARAETVFRDAPPEQMEAPEDSQTPSEVSQREPTSEFHVNDREAADAGRIDCERSRAEPSTSERVSIAELTNEGGHAEVFRRDGDIIRVDGSRLTGSSRLRFEYTFVDRELICARETLSNIHVMAEEEASGSENWETYWHHQHIVFADGDVASVNKEYTTGGGDRGRDVSQVREFAESVLSVVRANR